MGRLEINNRIGKLRLKLGLSGREFAEKLGVTRSTVNNWETGGYNVKADDIEKICNTFNVTADWLIGLAPEKQYSNDESIRFVSEFTGLGTEAIEQLHSMNTPSELGGDPGLISATDKLLAMDLLISSMGNDDLEESALVAIADYLQADFEKIRVSSAESVFDQERLKKLSSAAIERAALDEIGNALNEIKKKYYQRGESHAKESKQESER